MHPCHHFSLVITELEEESSADGTPPLSTPKKCTSVKTELLSSEGAECPQPLGSRSFHPTMAISPEESSVTEAADGIPHESAAAAAVAAGKRKCEQELVDLQREKVRRQIHYHRVQHELQMSVLRSQMEFWEMKKTKLAAEIRQSGVAVHPSAPTTTAT